MRHWFVGSRARLIVGLSGVGLVGVMLLALYAGEARAAKPQPPSQSVQLLSATFSTGHFSGHSTPPTTLFTLPFSAASAGTVQATVLLAVLVTDPTNPGGTSFGALVGSLSCTLNVDGSPIAAISDDIHYSDATKTAEDMTGTQSVASGSHQLALVCTGSTELGFFGAQSDDMAVASNGVSVVVVS